MSSLGDGMVLVGFPLLALTYTHDPALIAGVAVAGKVAAPPAALLAGAVADRVNRRRLLISVQLASFAVLGTFSVCLAVGVGGLVAVYLATFLVGALAVAFSSASAASVPSVVPKDLLVRANSRLSAVNLAGQQVTGQAVGGVVFAFARIVPFFADAVSFLASAALLPAAVPDGEAATVGTTLLVDVRAGIRWFLRNPLLRLLAGLIAQLAFCQAVVMGLLVLYATADLHLSKAAYGLLLGRSAIGNLVGSLAADRVHIKLGAGWCIIVAGVAAALAYPIMATTRSPVAACGALALEAVAVALGNVAAQSLRQSVVPSELQGRAWSTYMTLIFTAFPLGALAGGLAANAIGIRATFLAAGCLQLAVILIAAPRLLSLIHKVVRPDADLTEQGPEQLIDLSTSHGAHHDKRLPAGDDGVR